MSHTSPSQPRIDIIDVLRGFSLLGIVIIHTIEQYYAGMMPDVVTAEAEASLADQIAQGFAGIFIMGKFFAIFSFLFGLSFFIQFARSDRDAAFLLRFTWRLLILFAIGLLHHLHYRGDILTIYAMLGMGLLICYKLPDRSLLIIGLALIINLPSVVVRLAGGFITGADSPFPEQDQAVLLHYYEGATGGSYVEMLWLNLASFRDKMLFQVVSGRIFITFGLFLLGLYAGRKKYFETVSSQVPLAKKLLRYSWKTILLLAAFAAFFFGGAHLLHLHIPNFVNWSVGGLIYDLFNACLSLLYATAIVLLFQKPAWKNRLMNFYEVGRMGLTTYLMQTVFGVLIFFNYGLGLLSELSPSICFALAIVIFVLQIIFSKVWFRYFSYGPFEWLWRALTYFTIPQLRRPHGPAVNVINSGTR